MTVEDTQSIYCKTFRSDPQLLIKTVKEKWKKRERERRRMRRREGGVNPLLNSTPPALPPPSHKLQPDLYFESENLPILPHHPKTLRRVRVVAANWRLLIPPQRPIETNQLQFFSDSFFRGTQLTKEDQRVSLYIYCFGA